MSPKHRQKLLFVLRMEGKHLSYSRQLHHFILSISATCSVPSVVKSKSLPSSEAGRWWAQPAESLLHSHAALTQIPFFLRICPNCLLASRDKYLSSYIQYITLKSLQIMKCDVSLGHYYSRFNISQSKFFWNILRFRHSLKFILNRKVPCLHIIPK